MNNSPIFLTISAICGITIGATLISPQKQTPVIDLPEEWSTISKQKDYPDMLVGHLSPAGDTLFLRFDM